MSIEEQVKNYLSTEGYKYQYVGDDEIITFKVPRFRVFPFC